MNSVLKSFKILSPNIRIYIKELTKDLFISFFPILCSFETSLTVISRVIRENVV